MERISSTRSVKSMSAESYVGSPLLSAGNDGAGSPSFAGIEIGGGRVSPLEQSVGSGSPSYRDLAGAMESSQGSFTKPKGSGLGLGTLNPPLAVSPASSDLLSASPTPSYVELPAAVGASLPESVTLIVEPNFQAMYYEIADRIALQYNRCHSLLNPHELMLLSDCEVRQNNKGGVPARYLRTLLRVLFKLLVTAAPRKKGRNLNWENRAFLEPVSKIGQGFVGSSSKADKEMSELRECLEEENEDPTAHGSSSDGLLPWVDYSMFSSILLRCATEWCAILHLRSELLPAQVEVCHRRLRELLEKEKRRVPPLTVNRVHSSPYAGAISGAADSNRGPDPQGAKVLQELRALVRPASAASAVEKCKAILHEQVSVTRARLEETVAETHLITQANERPLGGGKDEQRPAHFNLTTPSEGDVYVSQWGSHRERVLEKALDVLDNCDAELGLKLDRMELKEEDEAAKEEESKKKKSRPSTAATAPKPVGGVFIKNELCRMRDAYLNRLRLTKRVVDTVERAAEDAIRKEKVLARTWVHDRFIPYPESPAAGSSHSRARSPSAPTGPVVHRNEPARQTAAKPQLTRRPGSSTSVRSAGKADSRLALRPASCDLYHQVVDPPTRVSPSQHSEQISPPRKLSPDGKRKVDCWRPKDQEEKRAALASGMLKMLSEKETLPGPSRYPDRNGNAALANVVVASRKRLARHYAILVETLGDSDKRKLKLAAEEEDQQLNLGGVQPQSALGAASQAAVLLDQEGVDRPRKSSVITKAHLALIRPGSTPLERHPQGKGKGPLVQTSL